MSDRFSETEAVDVAWNGRRDIADTRSYETQPDDGGVESEIAEIESRARDLQQIANVVPVETVDDNGKKRTELLPLPMAQVLKTWKRLTDDWPRRAQNRLFVPSKATEGVDWLPNEAALFGEAQTRTGTIKWSKVAGCVTKGEYFAEYKRTATRYAGVATFPHFPRRPDWFYACPDELWEPGDGETLREYLAFFAPATELDADLMKGIVCSLFGGFDPGSRPLTIVTADEGRGVGKTKFVELTASICGGLLAFGSQDDLNKIKTRILSDGAGDKRICVIDNLKAVKFSSQAVEQLVTCETISGHQLFEGEAQCENIYSWFITGNAPKLSVDGAQRANILKLRAPNRSADWEERVRAFIKANRKKIIQDVARFYAQPPERLDTLTRWASWEAQIIGRLPDPSELQKVLQERRGTADVEREETEVLFDHFETQLRDFGYSPEVEVIHLPTSVVTDWYNAAMRERKGTIAVGQLLAQMIEERELKWLQPNPSRTYGRGLLWIGKRTTGEAEVQYDLKDKIDYRTGRSPLPA